MFETSDCEQLIAQLNYEKDDRQYPDNRRRGQFKAGWQDATIRQQRYSAQALRRLTWRNLGYRLGQQFGDTSIDNINYMFDIFAKQYSIENSLNSLSWKNRLIQWVSKRRKIPNTLSDDFIRFFELAFENTRYPDESWFGIHGQTVSLVIGGIFLAAINKSEVWLLLDQNPVKLPNVEYHPVKSTQQYYPLVWAHLNNVTEIKVFLNSREIWQSYSEASEKILESPISHRRDSKLQRSYHKQPVSEFWNRTHQDVLWDDRQKIEAIGYFDVENFEDARRRVTTSIVQRQGQTEFRRQLLEAYDNQCPVTGCDVPVALEAAHIIPYQGPETNHVTNGLLLRADLHTLFDLYLLSIHPESYEITLAPDLYESCYQELAGRNLRLPANVSAIPNKEALRKHYELFLQKHKLTDVLL